MALLPRTRLLAGLSLALGALALSAAPAFAADIELTEDGFTPPAAEVAPGETIMWTNATSGTHTIVGPDGAWDSGPLAPGETFSISLRQEGAVAYGTEAGDAEGTITVTAAAPAPEPAADPTSPALPMTGVSAFAWASMAVAAGVLVAGLALLRKTSPRLDT